MPLVIGFVTLGGSKAVQSVAPPPRLAIVDLSHSGFAEAARALTVLIERFSLEVAAARLAGGSAPAA